MEHEITNGTLDLPDIGSTNNNEQGPETSYDIDWTQLITAADKFAQRKAAKLAQISADFKAWCAGSFECTLGWNMQFDDVDVQKMEGAIKLLEADSNQAPYCVDADNVMHLNVSLSDMQQIQLEMMQHYAAGYTAKQQLRATVNNCTDDAELDDVVIAFA